MGEGEQVLVVDGVCVSFSGRPVLDGVSFGVRAGEFYGLIGSNGSGKTTLLRTILGFQTTVAGSIRISGAGKKALVGYVPQKILLDPYLPLRARDVVSLGLDGHRLGLPLFSGRQRHTVDRVLKAVEAEGFADQRVGELSGGQQQRVLIAHALVRDPQLLLLDEPLANLDMRSAAGIVALLRRLCVEHRIAVLLSAHDMNPLLPVMDRIVYLANGHAASGSTDEVVRSEVLSRLYGYHIDVVRVHGRILVVAAGSQDEIRTAIGRDPAHVAQIP
ncbi:metal ABC transporter ATP-binding protein [Paraburkholderia sp. MM5477-R1]|uniref:metal ABC transporter ATP-binding protein n=1 Tax=Paraburkholderia sp. MM5477-R1 TaxID=2991062 RepID=UPI003D1BA679